MDYAIRVNHLSKKYRRYGSVADAFKEVFHPFRKKYHDEFWALKDISFEVKKGESVGIIGRNGSGKSTLLQILCGVMQPTEGEVSVRGRVSALLELGAGFHPQFSGRENVYLNGAIMGLTKEEIDARFDDIVDFADIGDFVDQPVKTYSSGMFVRLAFAAAINVSPDILVVDEALAVGDMFFQAKCMVKIKEMMDRGVTILFVTHDMNTVKSLCHKSIYLHEGAVCAFGASQDVTTEYLQRMFRGTSEEFRKSLPKLDHLISGDQRENDKIVDSAAFKMNPELMKRTDAERAGTGEACITEVEVLGQDGNQVVEAEFGEEITVRIHVLFNQEIELSPAYRIRDDKLISILSCGVMMETGSLIKGRPGEKCIVDFKTKIPLVDGAYNVMALLSRPVIINRNAQVIDYVENACFFRVTEKRPYKVWSKVYLQNEITIRKGQ